MLPLQCDPSREKWKCRLTEDWAIRIPRLAGRGEYRFATEKTYGRCVEWLVLADDGTLTLREGYGTDGCSVVPDFPEVLPGCVLHDGLRQAAKLDVERCPWTSAEADVIFREVMKDHGAGFLLRWTYYVGVAGPTGWVYSLWNRWFNPPRDKVCSAGIREQD